LTQFTRFISNSIAIPLLSILLMATTAAAIENSTSAHQQPVAQELDIEKIGSRIADLESLDKLDKDLKSALDLYRSAQAQLKSAKGDDLLAEEYRGAVDSSTKALAELESELKQRRRTNEKINTAKFSSDQSKLKQQLDKAEAVRSLDQNYLAKLELELRNERLRPDQTSSELQESTQQLDEIERKLHSLEEGKTEIAVARRISLVAERQALTSRVKRLEMERLSYTPRLAILKMRIELAEAKLKHSRMLAALQQDRLNSLLSQEAEQAHKVAEKVAQGTSGQHQVVQTEAEYNTELSLKLGELAEKIEQLTEQRVDIASKLKKVRHDRERLQQQVNIAGIDDSLGQLLLAQQRGLPDVRMLALKVDEYRQQMSAVRTQQFKLADELQQLADAEAIAGYITERQPIDVTLTQFPAYSQSMQKLLQDRVLLLNKLSAEYDRYESALSDTSLEQHQLSSEAAVFQDFLNKNLAWIPSAPPLGLSDLGKLQHALVWLFSDENWSAVALKLRQSVSQYPARVGLVLLLVVVITLMRKRMLEQMESVVPKIGKVNHDRFRYSLIALVYTFLLALPPALLVGGVGWLLYKNAAPSFVWAVGFSAMSVSALYLVLRFSRYLVMQNGLARNHLRWDPHAVEVYAKILPWLTPLFVAAVFVGGITEWELEEGYWSSLGRVMSLVTTLVMFWFARISLNPENGALSRSKHVVLQGLRLKMLWYPLAFLLAFGLLLLTIQGYHYTAVMFKRLLFVSFAIGVFILLIHSFAMRWLMIAERRLALKQARARREAAQESKAAKQAADEAGEGMPEAEELEAINLATISEQTQRLLRMLGTVAFFVIMFVLWSTITPALGGLDDIVLWYYQATEGESVAVSLWDLLLASAVVVLMLLVVRNLSGLLEITLLQPLNLQPGNRYAVTMVSRYAVLALGFLIALNMLGIGWGDVQWLVAAMGVGLGFGLKEIFANFFSGLIILFERPVRIGDTVTIDGLSGTVTKIRIRATTVTDFDNKEQVIPNQNFLTNPLINWTLSDPVTRVVFSVGIAYGSDTEKALEIMTNVVQSHPEVLEEPRPTVFFLGFGDSSLDFEVRAFVRERIRRLPLMHDLHMAMNRALAEAGLEIPFPQRDLHLRSVAPDIDLTGGKSD
jgi:potassium efflux system protein